MNLRRAICLILVMTAPAVAASDADLRREAEKRAAAARQTENRRARSNAIWRSRLDPRLDEDRDGVPNADDWCLRTRPEPNGSFNIDAYGCAPYQRDGDGDGIADAHDQCPNSPARGPYGQDTLVDKDGCEIWVWRNGDYTSERVSVRPSPLTNLFKSILAATDKAPVDRMDANTSPTTDETPAIDATPTLDVTWATEAPLETGTAGQIDDSPSENRYVATLIACKNWIMYPPLNDRPLRTGLLCAAAAGLIGLLAAFVTNRVQKHPIDDTLDRRHQRRAMPIAKRR